MPHLHLEYYVLLLPLQLQRDVVGICTHKGNKNDQKYSSVPYMEQLKTEKRPICVSGRNEERNEERQYNRSYDEELQDNPFSHSFLVGQPGDSHEAIRQWFQTNQRR